MTEIIVTEPDIFPPDTYWAWNRDAEQEIELDSLSWRLRYRSLWLAYNELLEDEATS